LADVRNWSLKNAKIGDLLACGTTTSNAMANRRPRLDSAHQIGLNTLWVWILIIVGGRQKLELKNSKIGNVLPCGNRTSDPMVKRTPRLDSAHQIGPNTLWVWILIIVGGHQKLELKNTKIGDILACGSRTSNAMVKRRPELDSAHQIGLNTLWVRILIVVGGCQKLELKNCENRRRFGLRNENQQCYGEMDTTAGFSASNRSKYALGMDSNYSWATSEIGVKKTRKSETFWLAEREPAMVWPNGRHGWIQRIE